MRRHRRHGVSEVIAIMMLVLIVMGAVVILLAFGTGVIHGLIQGGVSTPLTASGEMTVPGGTSSTGIVSLSLKNNQGVSISGVTAVCPASFTVTVNCVTIEYQNNPIVPPVLCPPGGVIVGSAPVTAVAGTPFAAGDTYTILVQVSFASGSEITVAVSVTAIS